MKREPVQRVMIPTGINTSLGNTVDTITKVVRPFEFRYQDWLTDEEVGEFQSDADLHNLDPTTGADETNQSQASLNFKENDKAPY
jgi:hypothetical protein